MKTFNVLILLSATLILSAVTSPVFAQQAPAGVQHDELLGPDGQPGRGGSAIPEEQREEIRKKIEAVRIWRLTEALQLDTSTSTKLAALLGSFDQQRRAIQHEQMEKMRTLRQALKAPKPDEATIKAALETLEKNHTAMDELKRKEMNSLKSILTIEQQARYVVFQLEFQREIRGMIAGARAGVGKSGKGPGARGGMRGSQTPLDRPGQQPEN